MIPAATLIEITCWAFGSEGSAKADTGELWSDWYGKKLDAYQTANPGITINFALKGMESGGTTLYVDSAVTAGTPPTSTTTTSSGCASTIRPACQTGWTAR
jgi:hypothetical protein